MDWSLDRLGARTTKLWPFEAPGALGTAAAAKAPRGRVVFQNKSVSWKSLRGAAYGGCQKLQRVLQGRVVSLPTPKCPGVTQGSPGVVWLVLGPHHGDSHTQGSRCGGRATKDG